MAHILLVEDEPGILLSLKVLLEIEGYRVSTASNGRWALECLEQALPDLVVTDYAMPYADGGELIETIRSRPAWKHLPVILMSGMQRIGSNAEAQADVVLLKPLKINAFLNIVAQQLQ